MVYILYKTTNLVTGKFYVGIHKQRNNFDPYVFDGYLGSGKILKQAIEKHGKSNFVRETLQVFNTLEEAKKQEHKIVNKVFLEDKNTYNLTIGGGVPPVDPLRWKGRKHSQESLHKMSINRKHKGAGENHWTKNPEKIESLNRLRSINSFNAKIRNITLKPALGHVVSEELKKRFSEKNKNLRWYKNLQTNVCIFSRNCPEGFIPGRLLIK